MYTYFKIRNFRCFQELELDDLALVNLIAGANNVGKTALLEAIFLHCGAYNPQLTLTVNAFRGIEVVESTLGSWFEHPLNSLFNQFDVSKSIELVGQDTVGGHRTLRLRAASESLELAEVHQEGSISIVEGSDVGYIKDESKGVLSSSEVAKVLELEHEEGGKRMPYRMIMDVKGIRVDPPPPAPPFQGFFQGARMRMPFPQQAMRYGKLELYGEQDQVLRMLSIIEPRLKSIRSVAIEKGSMLHGDIGTGRLMPLALMGEGMVRLADLAVNIGNAPNGVVLVDEIENGLHYSVIRKVWKAIALAARQSPNTQVFATTHSWECIKAAHEAFASEETYDFRLHRLGWLKGEIKAVTYSQGALAASLKHGMEVR
jgi:hypothetical protein